MVSNATFDSKKPLSPSMIKLPQQVVEKDVLWSLQVQAIRPGPLMIDIFLPHDSRRKGPQYLGNEAPFYRFTIEPL